MEDVMERVVMMGGSHSSRVTDELDETCLEVMAISVRGWRLSEEAVEDKVKELTETVSQTDEKITTIVYQIWQSDGSRRLPEKGPDGKHHVDGRLEIATRKEVKCMVSSAFSLLRAGGQCRKIILMPGSRYRYNQCCLTKGHCSNLKGKIMTDGWLKNWLRWVRGIVRDYVRMRNIKRATVMELGQLIIPTAGRSESLQEEEFGGKTLCS
jgi:hypothetical protein